LSNNLTGVGKGSVSVGGLSIGDWSVSVSWGSIGNLGNGWDGGLDDSWGRSVYDGVESVDWVSSVGNGTDSTIGLNKGVLSLDDISVAALLVSLGVSGQTVLDGVSVVVLWVGVVWLWSSGIGNFGNWGSIGNWSNSLGNDWSVSVGNWSGSIGWGSSVSWAMGVGKSSWGDNSGASSGGEGEESDDLDHGEVVVLFVV